MPDLRDLVAAPARVAELSREEAVSDADLAVVRLVGQIVDCVEGLEDLVPIRGIANADSGARSRSGSRGSWPWRYRTGGHGACYTRRTRP